MKLRAAREASGKTQKQVAEEAGIAERTYQQYEYGERIPNAIIITRISKALNSTVEELFGEEEKAKSKLSDYKTCELVNELQHRKGVETTIAEPYQDVSIPVNGPAIVLVVTD